VHKNEDQAFKDYTTRTRLVIQSLVS